MNFSKIAVAALGFNFSPWFVQGQQYPVDPYELHPIGDNTVSIGSTEANRYAWIFVHNEEDSEETPQMEFRLHFEGDFYREQPIIEVFSGVEDGDACDTGTLTDIRPRFNMITEGPLLDMQVTSNGAIGQVYAYMDLFDNSRWTPTDSANPEVAGTFKACARVSMQHDDEYVSFVDTTVLVHLNAEGTFQTFENDITVVGTSTKSLEDSQTTQIGLNSFLCGPSDSGNPDRSFKIGQSFSICVVPGEDAVSQYDHIQVVGFQNVQCGPANVVEDGTPTPLSSVATETTFPYKDADGNQVGGDATSFETVVTPDYYPEDGLAEETVTCSGTAELSFEAPRFEKTGCKTFPSDADQFAANIVAYPVLHGGTEDDVKVCNDQCRERGFEYFVLFCPFTHDEGGEYYRCLCSNDEGEQSDGLCSGSMEAASHCTLDHVSRSDYEFGLDRSSGIPVYRVNPKFTKAGCIQFPNSGATAYPGLNGGGTENEVQLCHDHCLEQNTRYFVLGCPFNAGSQYQCYCSDGDGAAGEDGYFTESTSADTCDGSVTNFWQCDISFVSGSDYEFGLGDHDLKWPAYEVNAPGRRLTTKFSINSGDLLQRDLQESSSSSFGTEVRLSRDNTDAIDDLEAPAARTAMASAAGALVVAAAALA